jgi:hypothetical protein
MSVKSSARCHDSVRPIRRRCVCPETHNLNMTPQLGLLVEFSPLCHAAFHQILRVNYDSSDSGHSRGGNIVVST